jgi:mono/diheme cytochrome c family protein
MVGNQGGAMTWRGMVVAIAGLVAMASTAAAQDARVGKGQKAFATANCKMCHSVAGAGNSKGPLDEVGSKLTAAEIKQWLTDPAGMTAKTKAERKPAMKLVKPLSADDLDGLVAYLSTLKKK